MRETGLPRTWRDAALKAGLTLPILFVVASLVGCSSTSLNDASKTAIVAAYNGQVAAGQTYNDAKTKETAASVACAKAAQAAGAPAPSVKTAADWPTAKTMCASLGAPIPFDPFALQKLAGPINALDDAIPAANNIRVAFEGGTVSADVLTTTILQLAAVFVEIEQDLVNAKITVPKPLNDAATALKAAGVAK